MAQSLDAAVTTKTSKPESHSFLGKVRSELVDFGEGLYHGAIESPINGVVQIADHVTGAHLPELHLVDEQRLSHSAGGVIGNIAGTALDIYLASMATAGIAGAVGGSGMVAGALRFGAVGAAYTTVFQPTDNNSKHFVEDRLSNGAVALATFAAMGGAGAALDATGKFAVAAARSLGSTISYGAIVGTTGGLVHAEANAIRNGKAVPTLKDLATDIGTYGAFGVAYAGAGYAINQMTAPDPRTFTTDRGSMTVYTDKSGAPVKVEGVLPSATSPDKLGFSNVKMTDGHWNGTGWVQGQDGSKGAYAYPPNIDKVEINGNKVTMSDAYKSRELTDGGAYKSTDLVQKAEDDAAAARFAQFNRVDTVNGAKLVRSYDSQMRLTGVSDADEGPSKAIPQTHLSVSYDKAGSPDSVFVNGGKGGENTYMTKQQDGSWQVQMNDQYYSWKGEVKISKSAGAELPDQVQVISAKGGGAVTLDAQNSGKPLPELLGKSAVYTPGVTGRATISVDASGHTTLTGGSSLYEKMTVNNREIAAGESVTLNPGDKVTTKSDIGDFGPQYEYRTIKWSKAADGTPIFGNKTLTPGAAFDYNSDKGGWVDEKALADAAAAHAAAVKAANH